MDEFAKLLKWVGDRPTTGSCMSLTVCKDSGTVELLTDTSAATYGEWIQGEGGDICIYRERDTNKVVGCRLATRKTNLRVLGAELEYLDNMPSE